ncbi:MAG: ABC-F family ATP-binding cassette domain-containing protein [Desulfobulbus sp.]|jgi:ATP-binding cassette subfamily F protein uup
MCALLSCRELAKSFGSQTLFTSVGFSIDAGDRIGLIGPNGSGKSTLLKIVVGLEQADQGAVMLQKNLRLGYVPQEDVFDDAASCAENLYRAAAELDLPQAERFNRAHALLSRAEFTHPEQPVGLLSGGWRKRLALCRALIAHPDLLLLDEPTNHLDLEGILWLERLLNARLADSPAAFLMISHDRRFLDNTVSRIIELGRSYPEGSLQVHGNYADFLEKKADYLQQQQGLEERLANKLRRETEWLRRGPKARATKARYRIEEAGRLQDELAEVRDRNRAAGQVGLSFSGTDRKTRKLLTAEGLTKNYPDTPLFSDLDLVLRPGLRLGLLGRNGSGKSTLMRILAGAGQEDGPKPDRGEITLAPNVRIVSFDQRREQLDTSVTLRRALAPEGDSVLYLGQSIHVVTWAKRFLFRPDQLDTPVERLSGGEQARILLARLMLQPADILLLDEPTNNLDIPALSVLEESLEEFPGALILVTHDRMLLDTVCNQVLGFDGRGGTSYFADHEQWLEMLRQQDREELRKTAPAPQPAREKTTKPGRLSYLDQREYDGIEAAINEAEARLAEIEETMAAPETAADPDRLHACWEEQQQAQAEVDRLYERWDELERLRQGE